MPEIPVLNGSKNRVSLSSIRTSTSELSPGRGTHTVTGRCIQRRSAEANGRRCQPQLSERLTFHFRCSHDLVVQFVDSDFV